MTSHQRMHYMPSWYGCTGTGKLVRFGPVHHNAAASADSRGLPEGTFIPFAWGKPQQPLKGYLSLHQQNNRWKFEQPCVRNSSPGRGIGYSGKPSAPSISKLYAGEAILVLLHHNTRISLELDQVLQYIGENVVNSF